LLQPGFHSGTVPRLYARLRQAERDAAVTGNWRAARVSRRALQEVEKSLRRLVAREMLPLLEPYVGCGESGCGVGQVELSSNRIRIELTHSAYREQPARLEWLEQEHWLVASVSEPGWFDRLEAAPRQAVTTALAGLYKLAGIDVVSEQVKANLPAPISCFDLSERDLVLWLNYRHGKAVLYDLESLDGRLRPRSPDGPASPEWPVLDADRILFSSVSITWDEWVESWQNRSTDHSMPTPPRINLEVLPNGQLLTNCMTHDSHVPVD
jgi:hypothetical protein